MNNYESLSHSAWGCKYHVIWIPKCRKKVLHGQPRVHIGEILRELARQKESWVLAQQPWIVPIPGTTNPDHLDENLGVINVAITPEELREFNATTSQVEIHGARLREGSLVLSDVETPSKKM